MFSRFLLAVLLLLVPRLASAAPDCIGPCLADPKALAEAEALKEAEAIARYKELIEAHPCVVDYRARLAALQEKSQLASEAMQTLCALGEVQLEGVNWCKYGEAEQSATKIRDEAKKKCDQAKQLAPKAMVSLDQAASEALYRQGDGFTVSFGSGDDSVALSTSRAVPVPPGKQTFYLDGGCLPGPQPFSVELPSDQFVFKAELIPELPACSRVVLGQAAFDKLHADGKQIALSYRGKELSQDKAVLVQSSDPTFELTGTCTKDISIDLALGKVVLEPAQIQLPDCPKPGPETAVIGLVIAGEVVIHERLGGDLSGGVSIRPVKLLELSGFGIVGGRVGGFGGAIGVPFPVSDAFNLGPQARVLFLFPYDEPSPPRPADDATMALGMGLDLKASFEFGRHSLFLLGGFQYFTSAPEEYSRWIVLLGGGARIGWF
jgi:hypothetical protein